jgi:hypothetical protein
MAQAEAAAEGKARARERQRKPKKKKRGAEYWLEDAQAGQAQAQYVNPPMSTSLHPSLHPLTLGPRP